MIEIQKIDDKWQFDKAYEKCEWDTEKFKNAVERTVNKLKAVAEKRKFWKQYNEWATELREDGNETAAKVITSKIEKFIANMVEVKTTAEAEKLASEYTAFFEDIDVKKWFINNRTSPLVIKFVESYHKFLGAQVKSMIGEYTNGILGK